MASNAVVSGPTAKRVAANVERVRKARQLHQRDLSARMTEVGRPMLATVISKIERGERRIDVDDLTAFALALNVSPLTLLLPPTADDEPVDLTDSYTVTASTAWSWAEGRQTAMDWDARPIASFDPSADPAISSELYEQEQEFGRRNAEYVALAQPPARRRQADHPAMRMLQLLSSLVEDLVTPGLNLDRVHLRALSRMTKRRYEALGYELEDIAEKLSPVHPGIPATDERTTQWVDVMQRLQDQNDESTTEDGGASDKQ